MKYIGVDQFDVLAQSETVTIGSGERFTTINSALSFYSKKAPQYLSSGVRLTLNLKAVFTMAEQVIVDGLNLGWITMSGADAETMITRSSLTVDVNGLSEYPAFTAKNNGTLPIIDQLFSMDTSGTATSRYGVYCISGTAIIGSGAGVKNAASFGLIGTNGSRITAASAIFSGAGDVGIYSDTGTIIMAYAANGRKGGTNSTSDFYVTSGGIIVAHAVTGGLSQTKNTITANGIIFQT